MSWPSELIKLTTTTSQSVTIGEITLTPEAHALVVRLPFAGFVWNRPSAVLVERGGQFERLHIINLSRVAQICLIAATLLFVLLSQEQMAWRKEMSR
jgi:hypothetical protein